MAKRAAGFLIFRWLHNRPEYLLLKASYGDFHWSPPKGHVDPGEDDMQTAQRETQEEAGYSTANDLLLFEDQRKELHYLVRGKEKTVVYWLAQLRDAHNQPILSEEHTDYKWLPAAEATALAGFEDFRQMVEHFEPIISQICLK